jgi:hypothetical protein
MRSAKCKVFYMFLILCYAFPNKSPAAIVIHRMASVEHTSSRPTDYYWCTSTPVFLEDLQVLEPRQ